ncbi:MAG: phosphate ABC transporter permease subunit PstC [Propionibacteriaceae bacterium]|jgi:phosphate transport system permease protein|nr:phosphate ABC transporter permease subunit PstC [Propionibacteriaceae bacterium]
MTDLVSIRRVPLMKAEHRRARAEEATARGVATVAGWTVVVLLAAVTIFLLIQGLPALTAQPEELPLGVSLLRLAPPLLFGSLWSGLLSLGLAAPVAIGVALFTTQYAPKPLARLLGTITDLLAAVPSVVYGLWGLTVLAPLTAPLGAWLATHLGWFPLFAGEASATGRTMLAASVVLAIMIMPIMTSVVREVFTQAPTEPVEAALGLGATKWESIRMAVLPVSRSGIVAGAMLGLGRALGETMAVAMVLSASPLHVTGSLVTSSGPGTIAAFIAQTFPEAHGLELNALIALGLSLFAVTFLVNAVARRIVSRPSKGIS